MSSLEWSISTKYYFKVWLSALFCLHFLILPGRGGVLSQLKFYRSMTSNKDVLMAIAPTPIGWTWLAARSIAPRSFPSVIPTALWRANLLSNDKSLLLLLDGLPFCQVYNLHCPSQNGRSSCSHWIVSIIARIYLLRGHFYRFMMCKIRF